MGHSIEHVDTRTAPEQLLVEMWEYYKRVHEEEIPGDPVIPRERQLLDWRNLPSYEIVDRWVMRDESAEIVAVAVAYRTVEHNLANGFARVHVREDLRGQGLGSELLAPVLETLAEDDRTRLSTYVVSGHKAGAAFAERLGMKSVLDEKKSRLLISDLDTDLMASWVQNARERAGDYDLVFYESPMPDEAVVKYTDLLFQMNTAPMDDYEMEEEMITPDAWRDIESKLEAAEAGVSTYVAVHRPTGQYVGTTTFGTDKLWPAKAHQWETVVHPDHRNKGLGRWLKAQMILDMADKHEVEFVDTENAGSNEPMLNINVAMGYKPILLMHNYQGDMAKARELI